MDVRTLPGSYATGGLAGQTADSLSVVLGHGALNSGRADPDGDDISLPSLQPTLPRPYSLAHNIKQKCACDVPNLGPLARRAAKPVY